MAVKRKRSSLGDDEDASAQVEDAQAIFRQHFEEQYLPLKSSDTAPLSSKIEKSYHYSSEDESEWDGFSVADTDGEEIEIIDSTAALIPDTGDDHRLDEIKAFMSPRPPTISSSGPSKAKGKTEPSTEDDNADDATNLKHDIALQRLLAESHLLDSSSTSLNPSGFSRHKANDLRLQSLGSRNSIFTQEMMPMSHRKGIAAKAGAKEAKRRTQAKENGIILEKARSTKPANRVKRQQGVDRPGIGSFKNGVLRLSKRDVASVQGSGHKIRQRKNRS
ncbi:MAG: hypothetical protein M1825_000970 [Sarcosagium campestre]|nr:MAG: hypothetical protein M1825_000970 [Sarcosagium campestre]